MKGAEKREQYAFLLWFTQIKKQLDISNQSLELEKEKTQACLNRLLRNCSEQRFY